MSNQAHIDYNLGERLEVAILICCARTELDADQVDRLQRLLQGQPDWNWLLTAADKHGLLPLLYQHLSQHRLATVPEAILAELSRRFKDNARRNLILTRELLNLLDQLEAENIMALPYKGPALAASAYGNLAWRQFIDLDILVQPSDVLPAKRLIMAQGYQPRLDLSDTQEAMLLQSNHQYSFWHQERQIYLELQWGFTRKYLSFNFDLAAVWQRRTTTAIGGRTVAALSAEDMLLILCVHGAKHFWGRLGWICDIAEHIRAHPNLDWFCVIEQAQQLGSERILYLGLALAYHLLTAPLPAKIVKTIERDSEIHPLVGQVYEQLFVEHRPPLADWHNPSNRHRLQLKMRERLRDRVRYCLRLAMAPTEAEHMTWPLPAGLGFVHNLLRPLRLVRKYAFNQGGTGKE